MALTTPMMISLAISAYVPPEQLRHEQVVAMSSAFSRFRGQGLDGAVEKQELPQFVGLVVRSMNSPAVQSEHVDARSSALTQQMLAHLPATVRRRCLA